MSTQRSNPPTQEIVPKWFWSQYQYGSMSSDYVLDEKHPDAQDPVEQKNLNDTEFLELQCYMNGKPDIGLYLTPFDRRNYYCIYQFFQEFDVLDYDEQNSIMLATMWCSQRAQDLLQQNDPSTYEEIKLVTPIKNDLPKMIFPHKIGTLFVFDEDYVYDQRIPTLGHEKLKEMFNTEEQQKMTERPYLHMKNYDAYYATNGDVQIYAWDGDPKNKRRWYSFNSNQEWGKKWGGISSNMTDGKHMFYNLHIPMVDNDGHKSTKIIKGPWGAGDANIKLNKIREDSKKITSMRPNSKVIDQYPRWRPAFQIENIGRVNGAARFQKRRKRQ